MIKIVMIEGTDRLKHYRQEYRKRQAEINKKREENKYSIVLTVLKNEPYEEDELYNKVSLPPLNHFREHPNFNTFMQHLEELERLGFIKHRDIRINVDDVVMDQTITIWWRVDNNKNAS